MCFASPCSRSGMRLRAPWDGLKRPRTAPRQPQYSPRRSEDGPRSAQDSPKTAQDGSQTVSRRPTWAPRSLRDGLRGSPERAGGACTGTDLKLYLLPRLHCPRWLTNGLKTAQVGSKIAPERPKRLSGTGWRGLHWNGS